MHTRLVVAGIVAFSLAACSDGGTVAPAQFPDASSPEGRALSAAAANVMITPDDSIPGPMDVVGVLDFHTRADSQDKGFDELKQKAAELGADAVIHAEFEHGDGKEPSHLSGVAVRRGRELPPYDVIRPVEVDTDEDAEDKGLEELKRRARDAGADEIVDIHFEHGEGAAPSKLTGLAVRTRR